MRSFQVISGENALAQQFINLRHDARGAGHLLVHQQLGAIALPTNPGNTKTLTLTINGTAVVITFVSVIGATAGNVLIGASAAATLVNLLALLNQSQTTTATGVAFSVANQQLVSYLSWPLSGTTITPSSNNTSLYAPITSFSAATTATGGSYTAQTMQLYVEPGVVYVGGTRVIYSGGSTPTVTAPVSLPRIDVLAMDNTGALSWTTGTENASPVAPTYPANKVALCELTNAVGETALYDLENEQSGQGYISTDVRPLLGTAVNLGAVASDVLPDGDGTRNLGGPSFEWNNIYAKSGIFLNGNAINTQLSLASIAGENISANAAVAADIYQSGGGIAFDAKAHGTIGSTSMSVSFTVGANSNRVLVVTIYGGSASTNTPSSLAYTGGTVTQVDQAVFSGVGSLTTYIIVAPTAGAHNLTWSMASATGFYSIYSYYNVAQSGTVDAHAINFPNTTSTTATLTTVALGALVVGTGVADSATGITPSGSVYTNNTETGTDSTNRYYAAGDSGIIKTIGQSESLTVANSGSSCSVAIISLAPANAAQVAVVNASSAAANSRVTNFLGFALSTVSAGAAVTVITTGVMSGFSSLALGQYYLNDTAGTVGTSPGTNTRKVGIALDTTHLLITNIW